MRDNDFPEEPGSLYACERTTLAAQSWAKQGTSMSEPELATFVLSVRRMTRNTQLFGLRLLFLSEPNTVPPGRTEEIVRPAATPRPAVMYIISAPLLSAKCRTVAAGRRCRGCLDGHRARAAGDCACSQIAACRAISASSPVASGTLGVLQRGMVRRLRRSLVFVSFFSLF